MREHSYRTFAKKDNVPGAGNWLPNHLKSLSPPSNSTKTFKDPRVWGHLYFLFPPWNKNTCVILVRVPLLKLTYIIAPENRMVGKNSCPFGFRPIFRGELLVHRRGLHCSMPFFRNYGGHILDVKCSEVFQIDVTLGPKHLGCRVSVPALIAWFFPYDLWLYLLLHLTFGSFCFHSSSTRIYPKCPFGHLLQGAQYP